MASTLIFSNKIFAKQSNNVKIKMVGDLDDDLFVFKATPNEIDVLDIFQMHNPRNKFFYNNSIYKSLSIGGYIDYKKSLRLNRNEVLILMTANERDELYSSIFETRVLRRRTHYKNEKMTINNKIFFPALMPERNSVKGYPVWYGIDGKANDYDYYCLWENSIVQLGIVLTDDAPALIKCYGESGNIVYKYQIESAYTPARAVSLQEKKGNLASHPFAEVGNIVIDENSIDTPYKDFISSISIEQKDKKYYIPMPYPFMYPNQIYHILAKSS